MGTLATMAIVFGGCAVIITITAIATFIIEKSNNHNKANDRIFLGQLVNTDCSMSSAVDYLKLTNGINSVSRGVVK